MDHERTVSNIAQVDQGQLSREMYSLSADVRQVRAEVQTLGHQIRKVVEFNKWLGGEIAIQGAAVRQARESADELLQDAPDTHQRLLAVEARLRAVYRLAWIVALVCLSAGVVAVLGVLMRW